MSKFEQAAGHSAPAVPSSPAAASIPLIELNEVLAWLDREIAWRRGRDLLPSDCSLQILGQLRDQTEALVVFATLRAQNEFFISRCMKHRVAIEECLDVLELGGPST